MAAASTNIGSHSLRPQASSVNEKASVAERFPPALRAAGLFEDSLEDNLIALFVVRCKTQERGSASQVFSI